MRGEEHMRKVSVDALKPGMIVGRPVYDENRYLLLNAGVELKKEYISTLKRMGVPAIYIQEKIISDIEIDDVILEETRVKAEKTVKNIVKELEKQPDVFTPNLIFTRKEVGEIIDEITEQLLANNNLVVNLADIRSADNYTFGHCVNVAVLALTTAIAMDYPRPNLHRIGCGALLHDLGKTQVPASILNKKEHLSKDDWWEIQKHPYYGFTMVKESECVDHLSSLMLYQHHERLDGSGYPQRLMGDDIHEFAQLCAVVDVYDALTSDPPYREAFPPHRAVEILEVGGEQFSLDILQNFFKHVAAFPSGTFVELSTGYVGVVVHNKVGFPRHPLVRVLCTAHDFKPVQHEEVDLMEHMDIVIIRVFNEDEVEYILQCITGTP